MGRWSGTEYLVAAIAAFWERDATGAGVVEGRPRGGEAARRREEEL